MSKGYKIYLLVLFIIFSIISLVAWKFGILELLYDTYYTPTSEWIFSEQS